MISLTSFIPIVVMSAPVAFLMKSIAIRKGRSPWGWFFLALIPYVNLSILWLVALPDKSLSEEIKTLRNELEKFISLTGKNNKTSSASVESQT